MNKENKGQPRTECSLVNLLLIIAMVLKPHENQPIFTKTKEISLHQVF
jgi:hypothetical protein